MSVATASCPDRSSSYFRVKSGGPGQSRAVPHSARRDLKETWTYTKWVEATSSVLRHRRAFREPIDDEVSNLKIVLVHHHHVTVPLYSEGGQVHEAGRPAGAVDGRDRVVAKLAALIIVGAGRP